MTILNRNRAHMRACRAIGRGDVEEELNVDWAWQSAAAKLEAQAPKSKFWRSSDAMEKAQNALLQQFTTT